MKMVQHLTILIVASICLAAFGSASAQTPDPGLDSEQAVIAASVSVSSVQVAEPFLLEVKCVAPVGTKVNFPAVIETLDEFDVIDHQDAFDVPLNDSSKQRSWTRQMTLESIVTGELTIPAIEVQVSDGTQTKRLASNPLTVKVLSVLEDRPDPRNFRDVKPLVDVEIETQRSHTWVGWTMGGLAGGLFFAWALIAFARRKRFITPAQWANHEFDQLEQSYASGLAVSANQSAALREPIGAADSEHVSCQLSSIIREFLDLQLDISAPNQATCELLKSVKTDGGVDEETANRIGELFALADQAKYAGVELSETQLRNAINEGRSLVNQIANQMINVMAAKRDTA